MKMFMDMSDEFKSLKIIAVGAVETARQVIEYDPEMQNRVAEIQVSLMSDNEIKEIIENGEKLLNFTVEGVVKRKIVGYSSGIASICHHLCLNMCLDTDINETLVHSMSVGDAEFSKALELYVGNAEDTLRSAFDKALRQIHERKFDNGRLILQALLQCRQDGATHAEIMAKIKQTRPDYPAGNLTLYLQKLQGGERGAVVRFNSASRKYSFSDPFYNAFARAFFEMEKQREELHSVKTLTQELDDATRILKRALASQRIQASNSPSVPTVP